MNGLDLQCERARCKRWVNLNVLCIVYHDHQRYAIIVNQSSEFIDTQSMVNPRLMGYDSVNRAPFVINFWKKEEENKKLKEA